MVLVFIPFLLPLIAFSFTIGTITDRPSKYYEMYRPFSLYIEKKLRERGIEEEVNVRFAPNIESMVELVRKGKVEVFIDSLYPSIRVCALSACEPVLVRWKSGVRFYRSVIFVRKDSPVGTVDDLSGKTIAFEAPFSTTGYIIPKMHLLQKGFRLLRFDNKKRKVQKGWIAFFFANEEENVVASVFFKEADAGAISDVRLKEIAGKGINTFRIIFSSEEIPRHIVNFSPYLRKDLRDTIVKILLSMDKDPEGREVLRRFQSTDRFELLTQKDLKLINKLRKWLRSDDP